MSAPRRLRGVSILTIILVARLAAAEVLVLDSETSACLSRINEYLRLFGVNPEKFEASSSQEQRTELISDQMRMALDQARDHLEHSQEPGHSVGSIFKPLEQSPTCSRQKLSATVASFREALDNCDQVSLDYLMIVANYKLSTVETCLFNEIARDRVELCWQRFVSGVSRQLDRVMGKIVKPVFRNLDMIAENMIETRREQTRSNADETNSIKIDEQKAQVQAMKEMKSEAMGDGDQPTSLDMIETQPENFVGILETLKSVDFGHDERVKEFAQAIYKLLNKQQEINMIKDRAERSRLVRNFLSEFFNQPCQELVDRVRSIVVLGEIYRRHIKQTLGKALAEEKQSNPRLYYELEVYRVCKYGLAKTDEIIEFMRKA